MKITPLILSKNFGNKVFMKFMKAYGIKYIETERNYIFVMSKRAIRHKLKNMKEKIYFLR